MADDDKPLEDEAGKVLPLREMMSLISTDPADAMHSTLVPPDASDPEPAAASTPGPIAAEKGPMATLPVEPPDAV